MGEDDRFCDKIPIFNVVKDEEVYAVEGQLYKYRDTFYTLAGYAPGCGGRVVGPYCTNCRSFLPEPTEKKAKRGKASVREGTDGKAAAAGERE